MFFKNKSQFIKFKLILQKFGYMSSLTVFKYKIYIINYLKSAKQNKQELGKQD